MKEIFKKMFCLLLAFGIVSVVLTSCGGGLPNGRYVPTDEYKDVASNIQAIVINGNNFTMVTPLGGIGVTVKYKYTNGTLTFMDGNTTGAFGMACEYKNDTLWYVGVPFIKTN